MGISGLLPFVKKACHEANIKEFRGYTVAIDAYCWLHRGAFACAEKLATGEKTDQYVYYCMKYINNLLSFGIKPIMVFDGCHLPSKRDTELARRERRDVNRKKAAQLLREGKKTEARQSLVQCIDITPQMALEMMNECRKKGVDCIVAPYEADSQLAYLNKIGVAQVIITEDSDLILFGCDKVMFKMDIQGNGMLFEQEKLNKSLDMRADLYTFDKFRYMCILSGCDYLSNLPGIGLGKASKVFKLTRQQDIRLVVKKLPSLLKMTSLIVTEEYVDNFVKADNTFLYQLVYDPLKRKMLPLNPYPPEIDPSTLTYAGPPISANKALQIALGNIDIYNGKKMADFDPDTFQARSHKDTSRGTVLHALSIWNPAYRPMPKIGQAKHGADEKNPTKDEPKGTRGKEMMVKLNLPVGSKKVYQSDVAKGKRQREEEEQQDDMASYSDLTDMYAHDRSPAAKKQKSATDLSVLDTDESGKQENSVENVKTEPFESPVEKQNASLTMSRNIFAVKSVTKKEKFNFGSEKLQVRSRYFAPKDVPIKKSSFFSKLADVNDSVNAKPDVDSDCEEIREKNTKDCENNQVTSASAKKINVEDSSENSLFSDEKPVLLKAKHSSPYSSFSFKRKLSLQRFSSSFNKSKSVEADQNFSTNSQGDTNVIRTGSENTLSQTTSSRDSQNMFYQTNADDSVAKSSPGSTIRIPDDDTDDTLSDDWNCVEPAKKPLSPLSSNTPISARGSDSGKSLFSSQNKNQQSGFYSVGQPADANTEDSCKENDEVTIVDVEAAKSVSTPSPKNRPGSEKKSGHKLPSACRTSGLTKRKSNTNIKTNIENQPKLTNFLDRFKFHKR